MNSFQVAQYAATLENYNKAIQIYEQVNDQLTSNIRENFLSSGGSLSTGVQSSKVQRKRALLQVSYKYTKISTQLVDLHPVKLRFSC